SGDLADLKVKSCDVEAWSPRQKKYFEVGSCSNLGDAQARRLQIRVNGENGARSVRLPANSSLLALDENEPLVWMIMSDGVGYTTIKAYRISEYVPRTISDLDSLEARIKKLEERLNESHAADAEQI
ncbi:MAG: hypothetical protein MJ137_04885, partial [Clostridia bacterium]|nr:hypothetical protein [Clostridia bacterium]